MIRRATPAIPGLSTPPGFRRVAGQGVPQMVGRRTAGRGSRATRYSAPRTGWFYNPPSGAAFDFYKAAAGGLDTNPGTEAEPFATFARCAAEGTGTSWGVQDGTHSDALGTVPVGCTVQAVNDGAAILTGAINPGTAGFTARGLILTNTSKVTGENNVWERITFRNGPAAGDERNLLIGSNTTIRKSLFHGPGGRYLFLAYQVSNVTMEDIILRPDGGWGLTEEDHGFEPHAACNFYDTTGVSVTRMVLFDPLSEAASGSELLGGIGINTHTEAGNVGTLAHLLTVDFSGGWRYWSDGLGSHDVTFSDAENYGGNFEYGMTRGSQCEGTTTATRFDTDANTPTGAFAGSINRTTGSLLTLDETFLNEARWLTEIKAVRVGNLGAVSSLVTYLNSFRP